MSFPSRTGKTPADVWFDRLVIRPIIAAMLLLAIIAIFGCATTDGFRNDAGQEPTRELASSCYHRAGFIFFVHDQIVIDDCMAFHGYRKAAQ